MECPKFMIAAASSESGKTVISCALMSAFIQKGMKTAACKCGPDYIDPMFHREVLGIDSENLDLFFCGPDRLKKLFEEHTRNADVTIIEGVMGYYDGMSLTSEKASSYDVARTLDVPVILVVPCKGMALSVMPLILGMVNFRENSNIRGILLNRVSGMLFPKMKRMIEAELKSRGLHIPVAGYIPEHVAFGLKSRHLGLITPQEIEGIREQLSEAGRLLSETVDLDKLLEIGGTADSNKLLETGKGGAPDSVEILPHSRLAGTGTVKIGIAWDKAFCFYYKDNLELLKKMGCELVRFSPLNDASLPEGIQGLLLGGGYPELYTDVLSENTSMLRSICNAVQGGIPCIAECGGFLYLQEEMEGKDTKRYPMVGALRGKAVKTERLVRFGYVELEALTDGAFFKKGESLKGHEFHYWDSTDNGAGCLAVKPDRKRSWECIHMDGNLFAGFPHIHFYSNPIFARRFVEACEKQAAE